MTETAASPNAPLVTVGIATFNRRHKTLPESLASALAQTYSNLEVLVCDNASEDGTDRFITEQTDDRLRYHRHATNIGANANFNACLQHARGDYFLLLPDDDVLEAGFVARAVVALSDGASGVALGGMRVIDADGRTRERVAAPPPGLRPADMFQAWFERRTSFYLVSTVFDTRRLREAGGFESPEHLFQDVVALARVAARHGYASVPGIAGAFRRHDGNRGTAGHAMRWTTDAAFLLDVLKEEMPADAERLCASGAPYLAQKCYRYVAGVPSMSERWRLRFAIHERLGRSYAPWRYLLRRNRSRVRRTLSELLARIGRRRERA